MHVDLTAHESREREAMALLDDMERSRWRAYKRPGPGRRFGLCRSALRSILAAEIGCRGDEVDFGEEGRGKPFALVRDKKAPISFNISHSGRHGLIAFAHRGRVGVDVEERCDRPYLDSLVDTVLSRDELAEVGDLPRDLMLHTFIRFWTIKEAIVKATGIGHGLDVARVETPTAMRRGAKACIFESPYLPGITLRVEDMGNEDFAAALAYEVLP